MAAPTADVLIVGGGLAGSLLALELRQRGVRVQVLEASPGPQAPSATAWSYGVIPGWPLAPTPLARAAAGASRRWRALQRRHGDLGWRPVRGRLLGVAAAPAWLARLGLLPLAQVDPGVLLMRLPLVLAAAGVERRVGEAVHLEPIEPSPRVAGRGAGGGCTGSDGWRVRLADGGDLQARQLVLAAGAACRGLWPGLPQTLQRSWAGVLEVAAPAPRDGGGPGKRPELLLPGQFRRIGLERRSGDLRDNAWVVDAGLVPRQGGALLGQLSWIAAAGDEAAAASGPPVAQAEGWLRQALMAAAPELAAALEQGQGRYRQVPVAFCRDGLPLAGPVAAVPGLWLFSGFSGGFAQVPVLAPLLAAAITAAREAEPAAGSGLTPAPVRELQRLGVWPERPGPPAAPSS